MRQGWLILLLSIISTSAFSAKHDGYIVKLKKEYSSFFGSRNLVKTIFGTFTQIKKDELSQFEGRSDVEYIEPNYIYTVENFGGATLQDSATFEQQWGLNNDGENSATPKAQGKAGEDINALKAWEITQGSSDIVIAVIDTGVDYKHKNLKENIWFNEKELNGRPGVDDDENGFIDDINGYDFANNDSDPLDGHGHGTHCAGVIGASHNDVGIKGVMAKVKIMSLKFLTDSGRGDLMAAVKSIDYAIKNGATILSNSWGGGPETQALKDAIERANEAGVVFVTSAGNSSQNNDKTPAYPANYKVDNVISVGAMAQNGKSASFSNYGKTTVHVYAPGVEIISTVKGGKYQKMSGTSMAAPHIAGVVGLIRTMEPNLSPKEIRERLIKTSVKTTTLDQKSLSGGRVDAFKALQ